MAQRNITRASQTIPDVIISGMASKSNPAASLAKWILVPVCLFLVGRFIIGPRIGKIGSSAVEKPLDAIASRLHSNSPPIVKHDPEAPPATQRRTERKSPSSDAPTRESKKDEGPDVQVTVQPASPQTPTPIVTSTTNASPSPATTTSAASHTAAATTTTHRRRHHKKATPPAAPAAAPKDEGSFGGTDEGAGKSTTTTTTGGGDGDGGSTPPLVSAG